MTREDVATRLRHLSAEKPTTKMGQVRWVWADIQAALAAGHTLRLVHERLNEAGIGISYRTLSLYIGRLERERPSGSTQELTAERGAKNAAAVALPVTGLVGEVKRPGRDPFANIRMERERKRNAGFEYDAFSINKNLLE